MEAVKPDPPNLDVAIAERYLIDLDDVQLSDLAYLDYVGTLMAFHLIETDPHTAKRWASVAVQALDQAKGIDPSNADRYELSACRVIARMIQFFGSDATDPVRCQQRLVDLLSPFGQFDLVQVTIALKRVEDEVAGPTDWSCLSRYCDLVERLDILQRVEACWGSSQAKDWLERIPKLG